MLQTRAQAGCVGCTLSTDVRDNVMIRYAEEWNSEEDLIRQLRSDRFQVLLELMERASEYPAVEFALIGSTRGLDYAEEIRGTGTN
jgi:quinol monooxygenase YgiN